MLRDGASSITWAAHAEIDGSTCIRDNAPCRTGSFGRLTFFHAAPRIAPLITNTVSCLCPPFPPPLLPPAPLPSVPPRSLNLLYPRAESARSSAPPLPSPLLLRRFRRTCPSRSSDSIAPPTPRLKKFEHRRPRCFGRGEGEGGRRRGRGYGGKRPFFSRKIFRKKIFRPTRVDRTRHLFANFETNSVVYLSRDILYNVPYYPRMELSP